LAGAKLHLAKNTRDGRSLSRQATSGPDGRFRFAISRSGLDNNGLRNKWSSPFMVYTDLDWPVQVMAGAQGPGWDWAEVGPTEKELTLRLAKDVPIRGRILDPDGKPVAGARLTVTGVSAPKGGDVGSYLEAVRKGHWWQYVFAKGWSGPLPGRPVV